MKHFVSFYECSFWQQWSATKMTIILTITFTILCNRSTWGCHFQTFLHFIQTIIILDIASIFQKAGIENMYWSPLLKWQLLNIVTVDPKCSDNTWSHWVYWALSSHTFSAASLQWAWHVSAQGCWRHHRGPVVTSTLWCVYALCRGLVMCPKRSPQL